MAALYMAGINQRSLERYFGQESIQLGLLPDSTPRLEVDLSLLEALAKYSNVILGLKISILAICIFPEKSTPQIRIWTSSSGEQLA